MNGTRVRGIVVAALLPCAVALAACGKAGGTAGSAAPPDTAKWSGLYATDTLPGEVRPRVVRLAVGGDTLAALSIEFVGVGTTIHPGRWSAEGDVLTMQPMRGDGTLGELPFVWRLDGARLVPLKWDRVVYGERGMTLTKQAAPRRVLADSAAGAGR
ncbi:MAG: hypothetical protein ABSB58_04035 [Gemmatimonadales bacterium]